MCRNAKKSKDILQGQQVFPTLTVTPILSFSLFLFIKWVSMKLSALCLLIYTENCYIFDYFFIWLDSSTFCYFLWVSSWISTLCSALWRVNHLPFGTNAPAATKFKQQTYDLYKFKACKSFTKNIPAKITYFLPLNQPFSLNLHISNVYLVLLTF